MKPVRRCLVGIVFTLLLGLFGVSEASAQQILPFPATPSDSHAGATMAQSTYHKRVVPRHLPTDAPNILVILVDDAGPGLPSTYGGDVNTPTLSRIAKMGISYNNFNSTAMCSPTRASLLTGRNATRVSNGQIAALANDFDGFSGAIPKTAATVAEVLKDYGYNTAAFGKWHNTPEDLITNKGPFDKWPTGYGFQYFYGFLAGEASQYEPQLVRNTTMLDPKTYLYKGYTLNDDITRDAIQWLRDQQSFSPDKPFFVYWAPGAVHGPHHVPKVWADKYKGKFGEGWDKYREKVFQRQKAMGWIPENTKLTPRPATLASWDAIPDNEKPFQERLMEVFAGFGEQTDHDVGKIIDELKRDGRLDNTLVFYIWGDNGSSSEGMGGTISEQLTQNGITTTIAQHIEALDKIGGLAALGGPKTDNMYNAGWAWAGSTPFQGTKLTAAYFGGTRQPMAVAWPKHIKHDGIVRTQFSHVIDLVPTLYKVLGITPPEVVNGVSQMSIDGTSLVYTFDDPKAQGRHHTQMFDIMASRAIYHDGWVAATMGPRIAWVPGIPKGIKSWTPDKDKWELYNVNNDWSEATDLAAKYPEKLQQMKDLFLVEAAKNKDLPIGGGMWSTVLFHPEDAPASPYTHWTFDGVPPCMPESTAPKLGKVSSVVKMEVDVPEQANGVLYALAGFAGGLTAYVKDNVLAYEFNMFEINRTTVTATSKLKPGKTTIEIDTKLVDKIGGPLDILMKANGKVIGHGQIPHGISLHFTSNGCFSIGRDLLSPVSPAYYDQAPFAFNGKIGKTDISYPTKAAIKKSKEVNPAAIKG